jgi:hypothetical protein
MWGSNARGAPERIRLMDYTAQALQEFDVAQKSSYLELTENQG